LGGMMVKAKKSSLDLEDLSSFFAPSAGLG
jgi:hypothetical protein